MKHGRKQAPVEVQLSYPTTNQPNEKTDETGRYVRLAAVDRASRQLLVNLELSPSQWTRLLAGEGMYIDDAQVSAYPHRLGKRHVHKQLESWKIADGRLSGLYGGARDAYLEEQRVLAEKTSGYEVVTIGKHNWGVELVGHAWVEPDEEA